MYKLYVIIEDEETGEEETMPLGIAERENLDDVIQIREDINTAFGEINPPLPQRMEDDFINDDELLNS